MSNGQRYEKVPCPCRDCNTLFRGTKSQVINNFNRHYIGAHIKKNDSCIIDESEIEEKINNYHECDSTKESIFQIIKDLYEIVGGFEPEPTSEDEFLNSIVQENNAAGTSLDLNNYLSETPVCREERQFAHFFANKLQSNDCSIREILEQEINGEAFLLKGDRVVEVFYEVTIMRDFWHQDKQNFNNKLNTYVNSSREDELERIFIFDK